MQSIEEALIYLQTKAVKLNKEVQFIINTTSRMQGNTRLASLNGELTAIINTIEFITGEKYNVDE